MDEKDWTYEIKDYFSGREVEILKKKKLIIIYDYPYIKWCRKGLFGPIFIREANPKEFKEIQEIIKIKRAKADKEKDELIWKLMQ